MIKGRRLYAKAPGIDWDVGPEYELIRQIGSGSYGVVCEAKNIHTSEIVAIKRISGIFDDPVNCKRLLREILVLRYLDHPNIIQIKSIIKPKNLETFNEIYIVMEYAPSDLKKLLISPIHLREDQIKLIVYNILCGLKYMHSANLLHRDLKPANILIYKDCEIKICDFGLARTLPKEKKLSVINTIDKHRDSAKPPRKLSRFKEELESSLRLGLTNHVVTRWYRAPEVILMERSYGKSIDVWSVGCIIGELCEMLQENTPCYSDRSPLLPGNSCFPMSPRKQSRSNNELEENNLDQLNVILQLIGTPTDEDAGYITDVKSVAYLRSFRRRSNTELSHLYPHSNSAIIYLIESMLQFDPRKRITIEEAISHRYFDDIRNLAKEVCADLKINLEFEDIVCNELRYYFINEIRLYN